MAPDFVPKYILPSVVILLLMYVDCYAGDEQPPLDDDAEPKLPDGFESHKFSAPKLTEEDNHSMHMPKDLTCDACRIITYLLTKKFQKTTEKFTAAKMKQIAESEVLDMVDDVCDSQFDGYGVKEVDGQRHLAGPGLETDDVPGMKQSGGRWPHRLSQLCHQYTGELGEEEIFTTWRSGQQLEDFICRSKELGAACPPGRAKTEL